MPCGAYFLNPDAGDNKIIHILKLFTMERNRDYRSRPDDNRNSRQPARDRRERNRENYFGPDADRYRDQENRNERMGRSNNDWNNSSDWKESDDYEEYRNRGSYGQGSFRPDENDQMNYGSTYGRMSDERGGRRDWNRMGSPSYERGESSRNWWDKTKDEVSGWFGDEAAHRRRENDDRQEHRGKGPKGYTRSDERIREDVNERLTDDGMIDASEIEVDVKNGEVLLKGTVKSRQEKRRTEDIIESISGVKDVENHLKVKTENFDKPGSGSNQYTSGFREKKSGIEYGPNAVSGMANTSPTGDFNTAK